MDILSDTDLIIYFLFTTTVVLLLIASIIIVVIIAGRQRIKQNIRLTETRLTYEKELRTTQQEIQTQILNQVSSELHDNIGQLLTLMRIQMQTGKIKNPEVGTVFDKVDETLSETIQQVRALSHSLNSDLLERKGLLDTISSEVSRLKQLNHFTIQFEHDEQEPSIENDQKLMVFRIFQESINNILKHAAAKKVTVRLSGKEKFSLSIIDDGKGYDLENMLASVNGAGLKNIIRRAELAHLNCTLRSMPGSGSSCFIQNM